MTTLTATENPPRAEALAGPDGTVHVPRPAARATPCGTPATHLAPLCMADAPAWPACDVCWAAL